MTSLSSLQTRVKALLMDTQARSWDSDTLTESIRLALGEYALAGGSAVTVSELDGAEATTLNALHESPLVLGAAAYAALARAVDWADSAQLGSESGQLKAWGDQRLHEFKAMLGRIFPGYWAPLSGSGALSGSGTGEGADPGKLAAEVALLTAQALLTQAQAGHTEGEESRAAATAGARTAWDAAEAARLAQLHESASAPWGSWIDTSERS
jgi:hypothetical protein